MHKSFATASILPIWSRNSAQISSVFGQAPPITMLTSAAPRPSSSSSARTTSSSATPRYCLGNLDGFDADDLVAPADMLPLDRWAITKLNELIGEVAKGYDDYEFHAVSHAINDFCVVELSSFYLDIIKDRLYCEEKNGLKRRSAQTALYLILTA